MLLMQVPGLIQLHFFFFFSRVATREESGVLGFPSSRGLTPRGSLECNPEVPAFLERNMRSRTHA